ncbi:MAG: hypothetical protein P8L65_02035 [Flavobacteriaceae bacterium]|nr:hypothetical protein [Flavobacteriaceae bacterium]
MSKEVKSPQNNSEEVDLVQLLKLIGSGFKSIAIFIGHILNKFFFVFVWIVFFTKKNILILIISAFVGLLFGYIVEYKMGPLYKSSMIIKQNYNTGKSLYNSLEYFNGLLAEGDFDALSKELLIDTSYISSIKDFKMESFITENQRYVEYNNYLKGLDSVLASEYDYDTYLEEIDESIYKTQLLTIRATSNDNFNLVFKAISSKMNTIPFFQREQERDIRELENTALALNAAIRESDSLQKTYKKVLENTLDLENGSQTSITFEGTDDNNRTREYELYKSNIGLRKELVSIERAKENKEYVVETLSNTPSKGFIDNTVEVMNITLQFKLFSTFIFTVIAFLTLIALDFLSFLEKYKNKI